MKGISTNKWRSGSARGGRPSLYTPARVAGIIAALLAGASRADAARFAGVGVSTFYVWLQLARQGHPAFVPLAQAVVLAERAERQSGALDWLLRRPGFWK